MNLLWDFDGTLFNTYPTYIKAFQTVLNKDEPDEEIYRQMKQSFGHAVDYYNVRNTAVKQYRELEKQISPKDKPPFPYVKEILQKAKANVIMTHKSRKGALDILNFHNMADYFSELVCGDDGYKRKPDPESYRYLDDKYHIDLAIGDRALDLIPARALGIKTCYFAPDKEFVDSPEAKEVADIIVESYEELLPFIK